MYNNYRVASAISYKKWLLLICIHLYTSLKPVKYNTLGNFSNVIYVRSGIRPSQNIVRFMNFRWQNNTMWPYNMENKTNCNFEIMPKLCRNQTELYIYINKRQNL